MPPLWCWFSGASLWLAGSFIVTIVLAIIGIRAMIPNKGIVLLIGLAILVMFIGWWTSADQELNSKSSNDRLNKLQTTLDLIASSIQIPEPEIQVKDLSGYPNDRLRRLVSDLAASMRAFEGDYNARRNADLVLNRSPAGATEEQRATQWRATVHKMLTQSSEEVTQFRIQFLPQARALREVMIGRIETGAAPSSPRLVALDYGVLAGPSPITELANYLEELARKLPP